MTPLLCELPRKPLSKSEKTMVLKYLANSDFLSASIVLGNPINAFTGDEMPEFTGSMLDDGVWYWQDTLICYVRDYDVALPEEFVKHVINYFDNGGKTHPLKNQYVVSLMSKDKKYQSLLRRKLNDIKKMDEEDARRALDDFIEKQYIKFHKENKIQCEPYL